MTNENKADTASPSTDKTVQNNAVTTTDTCIDKVKKWPIYSVGALAMMLLGAAVTVKEDWLKLFPSTDVQEVVKQLASDTAEIRMAALSQLQVFKSGKQNELQLGLVTVQELLSRRASGEHKKNEDTAGASRRETGMAMQALSNLLKQADKHHMTVQRPVFARLDLSGLDLHGLYFRDTVWQDVNAADLRLAGADLQGAHLDGTQLMRADASGADLTGATLNRVCLEGASLVQTKLGKARIVASDLNVAALRQADLSAATVQESRMGGADMTGAILTNADLGTATEWLPEQAAQAGKRDAASLPTTYTKTKLGICG